MKKQWFEHVKKVREQETRKRKRADKKNFKACSHKEAMTLASESWLKQKAKYLKKLKKNPPQKIAEASNDEN